MSLEAFVCAHKWMGVWACYQSRQHEISMAITYASREIEWNPKIIKRPLPFMTMSMYNFPFLCGANESMRVYVKSFNGGDGVTIPCNTFHIHSLAKLMSSIGMTYCVACVYKIQKLTCIRQRRRFKWDSPWQIYIDWRPQCKCEHTHKNRDLWVAFSVEKHVSFSLFELCSNFFLNEVTRLMAENTCSTPILFLSSLFLCPTYFSLLPSTVFIWSDEDNWKKTILTGQYFITNRILPLSHHFEQWMHLFNVSSKRRIRNVRNCQMYKLLLMRLNARNSRNSKFYW